MNILKQLYIDNIGVGLKNSSRYDNLDLTNYEYLVMGEKANEVNNNTSNIYIPYSLIVNNKGVSINSTRKETNTEIANTGGLYVGSDIICKGKIITNSIQLNNVTLDGNITNDRLTDLIKSVNSNVLFFQGYDTRTNEIFRDNIFTPSYITVGSRYNTYDNFHPLNLVNNSLNNVSNIHICMNNNSANDYEDAKFRLGIIGNFNSSPATITTTENMPLEFHISKSSSYINDIYNNNIDGMPSYANTNINPSMIINTNGNVGINTSIIDVINYNKLSNNNNSIQISSVVSKEPNLKVNDLLLTDDLVIYDFYSKSYKNIDEVYMRNEGLTLKTNQIYGGHFNKDIFTFTSNVNIGYSNISNECDLNVYGNINSHSNLINYGSATLNYLNVNNLANFYNDVCFNNDVICDNDIQINNNLMLSSNGNLFVGGVRLNITSNFAYAIDGFNIDNNSNLTVSGRLGIGINKYDSYNNQLTVIKRDTKRHEIILKDYRSDISDSYDTYIGHSSNILRIDDKLDNSFMIYTQKTTNWHNIYFYAGKDINDNVDINNKIPSLSIMQNQCVGINTNKPLKTLDVIGDIITNDYYIKQNNLNYKLGNILNINNNCYINNINNLNINISDINDYSNYKTLNVIGGINSYNGFYENTNKVSNFLIPSYSTSNAYNNNNIAIGINNSNLYAPLSIRNIDRSSPYSNSIIRIYRGVETAYNNYAKYSGIDICEYDYESGDLTDKYKWFIYKNHLDQIAYDKVGLLQIGYTYNSHLPKTSGIDVYYNVLTSNYHIDINNNEVNYNYNKNAALSVHGDMEVFGNINIISYNELYKYKYNNSDIILQGLTSNINYNNSSNYTYTNQYNDITMISNKNISLINKTSFIGYNDAIYNNYINNYEANINPDTNDIYSALHIYQNNNKKNVCKFHSLHQTINTNNTHNLCKLELGIINSNIDINNNNNYTIIDKNKVNFNVMGRDNDGDITILELLPNNNGGIPYISFYKGNSKNHIHLGRNNLSYGVDKFVKYSDTVLHIDDNIIGGCLLRLTNNNETPIIKLHTVKEGSDYVWNIKGPHFDNNYDFNINYNDVDIFNIKNNGHYIFNKDSNIDNDLNYSYTINSLNNNSNLLITNIYDEVNKYNIKPHITLQNYINQGGYTINNKHHIYSSNGTFDINLESDNLFKLNNQGDVKIKGNITTKDINMSGSLYDSVGNNIFGFLSSSSNLYNIRSSNININTLYTGGGILINGENLNETYNNIVQINNKYKEDYLDGNLLTLKSSFDLNFIHFYNTKSFVNNIYEANKTVYRLGLYNNTFGIWNLLNTTNITNGGYIDGTSNLINNYSKGLGVKYNSSESNYDYQLNGNVIFNNDLIFKKFNNNDVITFYNNNASYDIKIENNMYIKGNIIYDGNILTPSDSRIKTDIKKIENALDKIMSLNGIIYKNMKTNDIQSGLIAQDVFKILPEVVKTIDGYLNISYGNMMGLIIEGIKELKNEIDIIKNKLI